jgi:hypothetical protein
MPSGFSGLYFDDVAVQIVGLPTPTGQLWMDDVFIGTGGFSGRVSWTGPLSWGPSPDDADTNVFSGALAGELFGFAGGVSSVSIVFQQNALTAGEITGDVYVPYLEKRIGLTIGLDGAGGITAAAGLPHSTPAETGVSAGSGGYLLHVGVGSDADPFLEIDIDSLRFTSAGEGPALIELSGALDVNIEGLDAPPFEFNALRVDARGNIAIDGGWLDLREAKLAPFRGFPLEITRLGFGKEDSGCFWVGLNGGIKMADGLPVGASVEGLRVCWYPGSTNFDVSLKGVGLEFRIPNTLEFAGTVAFFSDAGNHGFKGSVKLTIVSMNLTIDAQLLVGRSEAGDTFFYLYLAVDLPTGIPLFSTGASIYGFAGLVATNMGPTRQDGEHWYYGWYLRNPKGVTSVEKWRLRPGAFAGGIGTTIGTATDDGFAFSAKVLLVLLLPGPQFLLQGKGKFVKKRADSQDVQQEGNFDALVVLDFPGKIFQSNLAAAYSYADLLTIEGGTDVAFSWAPSPPPDIWHVYLGEKAPPEKRIRATLLKVLRGSSYFQLTRHGIETGTWVGLKDKYRYGPVRAWFEASVSGDAAISWNPGSFVGGLRLVGSAGISAFSVRVQVSLNSSVTARGPRPWYLEMRVELSIEVDLWFVEFSKTIVLPLTWGDPAEPLPLPLEQPVLTLAAEHLKIDETFRFLSSNTVNDAAASEPYIPPDARPVVIFQRPIVDGAAIGSPSLPAPEADDVGVRSFSYRLAQVSLIRRDGGQRVICAAGKASVSGTTATLAGAADAGLTLAGLTDATLELVGYGAYRVTAASGGSLTLAGSPPSGDHSYRLQGREAAAAVQVNLVSPAAHATAVLTLSANHGRGYGKFAGGSVRQESKRWTIVADTGTHVTVRTPVEAPVAGAATLEAASGGLLEGQWLPADDREAAGDATPTTKLMLWARTPFAWFRRTDSDGFVANNPSYPCGPAPVEEPVCLDFDDLKPGPLSGGFRTSYVWGRATGTVKVVAKGTDPADRLLWLPMTEDAADSTVTFQFMAPVGSVEVRYLADSKTKAWVVGRRRGAVISKQDLTRDKKSIKLPKEVDEASIVGRGVVIVSICVRPGWICVRFDPKMIPSGSTGQVKVDGLTVETLGTMEVKADVLNVFPLQGSMATVARADSSGRVHSKYELLPGAPSAHVGRLLGPRATAPVNPVPRIELRGVHADMPTYLPGIGAAIAGPPGRPRPPRDPHEWRIRKAIPLFDRTLPFDKLVKLTIVDAGASKPVASVAFLFPYPVTRVYVAVAAPTTVIAYKGAREILRREPGAEQEIEIKTSSDYIDRIVLLAAEVVRIIHVCYDDGNLGWQLVAQEGWQASLAHSIEWMYREDPLLTPGDYRIEVITQTIIGGTAPDTRWTKATGNFKVGPPPGTRIPTSNPELKDRYPHGGPLTDLATYVERTMPAAGQRPFYRSFDVGVVFRDPYISRMFLAAGQQLSVVVLDSNDRTRRGGSGTFWVEDPELAAAQEVEDWIGTVNADKGTGCPTINVEQTGLHSETLSVGAGELLSANELHAAEVRTSNSDAALYRFEFVTSRFANFRHHMALLDRRCRARSVSGSGAYDPQRRTAVRDAFMQFAAKVETYQAARTAISAGTPTAAQFAAFATATADVSTYLDLFRRARNDAFDAIWTAYFTEPPAATLPENVEISRVIPAAGATASSILLLESPEPIPWDRLYFRLGRSATFPLRRRQISIDRRAFGAPDAGATFTYGGCRWTTDVELQVTVHGVAPRVPGPWTITIEPAATWVQLVVRVDSGGSAQLHGDGVGVSGDVTLGPTAGSDGLLAISGDEVGRVTLTGSGTTIVGLTIFERFTPEVPRSPVRLVQALLPATAADDRHFVDLTTYAETDISGWTIRWSSSSAPMAPAVYHIFAAGTVIKDAESVRVYGSLSNPPAEPGLRVVGGGTVGIPPSDGVVLQLHDSAGRMVHEISAVPDATFPMPFPLPDSLAVSGDGTRAFFLPLSGSYERGQWRLQLEMSRAAKWGLPAFAVGGDTSKEIAILQFTAE